MNKLVATPPSGAMSIICDRCGHPPTRFTMVPHPSRDAVSVHVRCHGEETTHEATGLDFTVSPNLVFFAPEE